MADGFFAFPALKHWEEAAHHLLVFFLRDGLPGVAVQFVYVLCTMVNHLLHGAIPVEFAFIEAIFAVVEANAAIGIGGALFVGSERHAATLAKLR